MPTPVRSKEPRLICRRRTPRRASSRRGVQASHMFESPLSLEARHDPRSLLAHQLLTDELVRALTNGLLTGRPEPSWVWDSPRVKAILERPEGTPIDLSQLTEEEKDALAQGAKGMWADHPYIKDSVDWVRGLRKGLAKGFPGNA